MKTKATTPYLLLILFFGLINLQFLCFEEDNENPTCQITAPTNGQQIVKGEIFTISVEAEDSDGTIIKVDFFIDDIAVGSSANAPYTYQWNTAPEDLGGHNIRATATDDGDATSNAEVPVTIIQNSAPPVAAFEADVTSGSATLAVTFTDLSTNNPESWQWNFGDGGTSTEQNPSHDYTSTGTYSVSLTATNAYGSGEETKTDYIHVSGAGSGSPCPGMETVTYEGQVYNTVIIGEQCWFKENLNVGEKISSLNGMYDNGILEKYCYNGDDANCETYGALYQWKETMQYNFTEGARGICPEGWHIPTNEEWKTLEGAVDTQFDIGDPTWNNTLWRGSDVGIKLKSTTGWDENGNGTNDFGFSALPVGYIRLYNTGLGASTYLWTSKSENSGATATYRRLDFNQPGSFMGTENANYGHSVRCLRDY